MVNTTRRWSYLAGFDCTLLRASSYEPGKRSDPVGGTNFVFCSYGKLNPGYRDEKCPKGPQNTRGTAFRLVSDLTSHAQLKMFRHGQSLYPGWSVHMEKISSSVTEISVTGPDRLLIWTHRNFCKEKSGEARSRKPSQPGRPCSYEETLKQLEFPPQVEGFFTYQLRTT